MHAVNRRFREVNEIEIVTYSEEICSANILEVEAGSTGYCGGDSGHGARTYIRLEDLGGTDITVVPIDESIRGNGGVEIILGGDCELSTVIEALEFITQCLKDSIHENGGSYK